MAMSDCPKCWETPCVCGHEYKMMTPERKIELVAAILGVSKEEIQEILVEKKLIEKKLIERGMTKGN